MKIFVATTMVEFPPSSIFYMEMFWRGLVVLKKKSIVGKNLVSPPPLLVTSIQKHNSICLNM